MKQMLLFIAIFILGVLVGTAQELTWKDSGLKYFKYYSNKDYNDNPQNWAIGQDPQGIIYVANQGGVLQFDGLSWESVEIPNISARSLAIGDDGVVYIGGENQIGKLIPGSTGQLYYQSLVNFINQNQRYFARAWRVNTTKEGIFFRTGKYLFSWNPVSQNMKTWQAKHLFSASFSCRNTYYIHDRQEGLMHVENGLLSLVPGGEKFTGIKIYMIATYGDEHLLVGTRENGFFIYDGLNRLPFTTEADDYIKKNKPCHGIRLSSGEFALATTKGGLVIIDGQGRLKKIFSKAAGLPDNIVRWVFQ